MKKALKVILLIGLVLVLGGAGAAYYFFKVKDYEVADKQLEKITDTEYDIVLPDDKLADVEGTREQAAAKEVNRENEQTEETAAENEADVESQQTSNHHGKGESGSTGEETQAVTVASIKQRYRPSFENLQAQANGKIDSIVSRAISEFQQKKQNGESISYSYFYQKYSGAGAALEAKTDAAFQVIYSALENELKENGFSATHAKEFQESYESAKRARENALLAKAKGAL